MLSHDSTQGGLTDFERRLADWRPDDGGLDRERMLFEAGFAAGRSHGKWRTLPTGLSLAAAVGFAVMFWSAQVDVARMESRLAKAQQRDRQPAPAPDSPIETATRSPIPAYVETAPPENKSMDLDNVWTLRNQLLASGGDFSPRKPNSTNAPSADDDGPTPVLRPLQAGQFYER